MASYNPSFSRDARGKFNPELGFVSIKGGTDAYLVEDELNELQWIQNEARAELVRKMTNSGCMQTFGFSDSLIGGGLKELPTTPNSFLLGGFETVLNGYLAYIDKSDLTGNIITLPAATGTRQDFVFLEFWFRELQSYETVKKFGGINNDPVGYQLIDSRMGVETAHRVQLQWNIRSIADVNQTNYAKGFIDELGNSNLNIHPKILNTSGEYTSYNFSLSANDANLYISGNGIIKDELGNVTNPLGTADGYVYAIPLFFVNRSDSEVITADQIIDIRSSIAIGRKQLDDIYVGKIEFNSFKDTINNTIATETSVRLSVDTILTNNLSTEISNRISSDTILTNNLSTETNARISVDSVLTNTLQTANTQIADISGNVNILQGQVTDLITVQIENTNPRLNNLESGVADLQIDFANVNNNLNVIINRINNIDERLIVVENELRKLGIDLSFSNLLYYGTDLIFNSTSSMGSQILPDGTINCTGVQIESEYTGYNNYAVLYTAEASPSGKLGDIWIEKADTAALLKNSGYGGISFNNIVIKNTGDIVTVVSSTFNGMTGVHVDRILGVNDFLYITPTSNQYGTIGEIYYTTDATGFTVYNTGSAGTTFDYTIIDITNMRNVILGTITYGGTSTVTGVYGENFKAFIGPSNIPSNQGSIGDVTVSRSLNTFTVYNTGSTDNTISAKYLIFIDPAYIEEA